MAVEQILQIAGYVVAGLAVLFSIAQFIYNKATGSKSKFLTKSLDFINEIATILGFAEQMTKLNGNDKKEFAKNSICMYCENKNIKISDEQLDAAIEILITLTKKVNAREKDLIANDELVGNIESDNTKFANNKSNIESGDLV